MNKKYIDVLKEYLLKNQKKSFGYTEEEIKKIEKLYEIGELKGDFREFMKFSGKSDGGLLGDDVIILYNPMQTALSYLMLQEYLKIELSDKGYEDIIKKKPFVFSVESENTYNFINTMEEDLKVYSYDENEEKVIDTKMNFNTFMIEMIEKYNPKYRPVFQNEFLIGNILIEEDNYSKEEIIKEKKEILLEKNELSFFEIAKQYILKTNNTIIGYTDKEIKIIEKMYEVKINGKLKKFLKNFGRSFGGLLTGKEIIFYNNWSIRRHIINKEDFIYMLAENGHLISKYLPFIISEINEQDYYFLLTVENDEIIYHYNTYTKKMEKTKINFEDYIENLIKKYNPNLENREGSFVGELIKL